MDFVYCSDENYAPYVGVSLLSLLETNSPYFKDINIHIIHENMSNKYMDKLWEICGDYDNVSVNFYKFDIDSIDYKIKVNYNSVGMLYRLFLPSILCDVDKVIYLDVDSIISGSFKELYDRDISNYYLGGVNDFPHYNLKKKLGLEGEKYFNSGFLYMNLNKLRDDDMERKFVDELNNDNFKYIDQDVLNVTCHDKILWLPPKYNLYSFFFELDYNTVAKCYNFKNNYYSQEEINEAKNNVIFNHFLCLFSGKPWNYSSHPLFDKYVEFAEKTPFDKEELFDLKQRPLWQRLLIKILDISPKVISSFLTYATFRIFYYDKEL